MQGDKDIPGISCGLVHDSNVFEWEVMLMISDEDKYYGGIDSSPPQTTLPTSSTIQTIQTIKDLTLFFLSSYSL